MVPALLVLSVVLSGCGGGSEPSGENGDRAGAGTQGAAQEAAPAEPRMPIDPETVGEITGQVFFEGQAPPRVRFRMQRVPACARANPDGAYSEEVVVNDNKTLRDVFVYVKDGLGNYAYPAPAEEPVLDQKGCVFIPHVLGIMAGQKLRIKNSDANSHNVNAASTQNPAWNESMPPGGGDLEQQFARPEIMVPVKCNVHPWMKAFIGVVAHPFFAVTDDTGSFTIRGLPPGEYTLATWQEKYGVQEQKITLGPKETKTVRFEYSGSSGQ